MSTFTTEYIYDRDDRIAAVRYNGTDATKVTYIYDDLGRIETRKAYNGSNTDIESYGYAAGYHGYSANATTDLVTSMHHPTGDGSVSHLCL